MNFDSWQETVPQVIRADTVWKMKAYRLGLFLADIGWTDVSRLMQDHRTLRLSDQLYRAIGSISANIAEGYSRNSPKERAHFYEYALGSARESRDWYYKGRHILGENIIEHRLALSTDIIRLLLTMIPQQSEHGAIREEPAAYLVESSLDEQEEVPFPTASEP